MRTLSLDEVLELHTRLINQSGGSDGLRDRGLLESALAQPFQTFGGLDLHSSIVAKAAALGFHLVSNHAFIDGNKRIGHAAMELFLVLNGFEIDASTDEQEAMIMKVAAGQLDREPFTEWLVSHVVVDTD